MVERMLPLDAVLRNQNEQTHNRNDLFSFSVNHSARMHGFVWRDQDAVSIDPPVIIYPCDDDSLEVFADVASFYSDFSPITAYFHVVVREFADFRRLCDSGGFSVGRARYRTKRFTNLWVAVAFAEAASTAVDNAEASNISFSICRRTLAFVLARAAMLYPEFPEKILKEKWENLRRLVNMPVSSTASAAILEIASLLEDNGGLSSYLNKSHPLIVQILVDLAHSPTGNFKPLGREFGSLYPEIQQYLSAFENNFDERIVAFTAIEALIRKNSRGGDLDSLALSYFANLIQPGSMAHLKLVSRFNTTYPSVLIWYGFFCGLSTQFNAESHAGGLGRKLLRDIKADFDPLVVPTCDIALDELEALSGTSLLSNVIKPFHQRAMSVALLPGVEIIVRVGNDEAAVQRSIVEAPVSTSSTLARDSELRELVKAMSGLLGIRPQVKNIIAPDKPKRRQSVAAKEKKPRAN